MWIIRTINSWREWLLGFDEQERYLARWHRSYHRRTANEALRTQRKERLESFAQRAQRVSTSTQSPEGSQELQSLLRRVP
jgi:hypothetical protein